jgi:hypothetical protein
MNTSLNDMFEDIDAGGNDDYIQLWIVINKVAGSLDLDTKKMTLGEAEKFWSVLSALIAKMLQTSFVAVDLTKDGGYIAWPEQEPRQVMAKIRNKWVELKGKFPDVGFIVWFYKPNKQPKQRSPKP